MSSRSWLCLPITILTALGLSAVAPRAHACAPLPPGVSSTIPANGAKYPGNAAVILHGQGLSLADAAVTVDGQPATLKDASKTLLAETGLFGATIEPPPAAGQNVVITGTFCDVGSVCPPVTLHYQATAADKTPPPLIDLVGFSIHDYTDFKSGGGDCQIDSDFAWWVKLKGELPDQAKDSPVFYEVEGYHDSSLAGGQVLGQRGLLSDKSDIDVTVRGTMNVLAGKSLPAALCFRVKAYDTAGNAPSVSEVVCKPCNYRTDTLPIVGFPPGEPTWTAADIYPGGTCNSSMSSSSSSGSGGGSGGSGGGSGGEGTTGDEAIGGCGCRMAGESDKPSGLFGALALALGAAVRIGRRRR